MGSGEGEREERWGGKNARANRQQDFWKKKLERGKKVKGMEGGGLGNAAYDLAPLFEGGFRNGC